jgi:polyphosphate kinase 2
VTQVIPKRLYEQELLRLQGELASMSEWIRQTGARVVVLFEGRDAAGKGGAIKRISEYLSPRTCRIVALPTPTERERGEWYFQRYVSELPTAGEMTLFDRSWYNRAGVDRVMGFCTDDQYQRFLRQGPVFEHQLIEDGIILIKYWFSVSDDEQERRFQSRVEDPLRRWKLSPIDLEARQRWVDYSRAKDNMFLHTDTPESPWYVVEADDKRSARLNCIAHLVSKVPYQPVDRSPLTLPKRSKEETYQRPPRDLSTYVPDHAAQLLERSEPGSDPR